jgi:hypothetical protein
MAFQIVELALDANDEVVERKVVPYPYQSRQEAVDTIESVVARYMQNLAMTPNRLSGGR